MAQSYTRQSTFADGDTITAALFNNEYDQLVNAFSYSSTNPTVTGHTHDGSAGQGGNIGKIGDIDFLNKIEVDNVNNRWGVYVEVTGVSTEQIRVQDGSIVPVTTNDIDLGTTGLQFKNLFIDGTASIDNLTLTSGVTVDVILDEDNLASDSATALATQQSIKAYVDAQVTAQDLDFQADTGGALNIDLDSETMVLAGGTGIDTSGALNTVTIAIDSTVATLTGTQTLTNKTIDASLNTLSNIANGSLTNSTVSYGGVQLSLGGSDATPAFNLVDATGYLGDSALVTTGALNSGSITSGFGSINVGSSSITTLGTVSGGTLTGTLSTAAQANVTSVGTLTSLAVSGDLTVDTSTLKVDSANNRVGILNAAPDVTLDIGSATDAVHVPVGTTAQRPGTPAAGYFRYNADLEQFEGYTDTWGAIGGGGTNTFTYDSYTGDNTTVDFVLSQATNLEGNLIVFIDGVFQTQDAYSIATASGITTLTFSAAPATGRKIVVYTVAAGVSGNNMNLDSFSGDGATTDFTLSINAINENNTQIFIDGVYQQKDGYSVTNTTLSFSAAPPLNSTIEVMTFTQTEVNVPVANTIEPVHIKAGDFYFDTDTLYIDSVNNRVGLGTSSPARLLELSTATASESYLRISGNSGNVADANFAGIEFYNLDGSGVGPNVASFIEARAETSTGAGAELVFATSSSSDLEGSRATERMRIDSSGNVGIGTTSPSSKLVVAGTGIGQGIEAKVDTEFDGDATTKHTKLTVSSSNTADSIAALEFQARNVSNVWRNGSLALDDGALTFLIPSASNTVPQTTDERMRITSSGNVGIGTTSPIAQLQIGDYTGASEQIAIGSATTGTGDLLFGDGSTGNLSYRGVVRYDHTNDSMQLWTSSAEKVRIDSSGNVGIGAQIPASKVDIEVSSGAAALQIGSNGSGGRDWRLQTGDTSSGLNGALRFYDVTGTSEAMRIDSSRNLLVGKTSADHPTTAGVEIRPDSIRVSRNQNPSLFLDRRTNDGEILRFQKDGTTVGSIGSADSGDRIYFAGAAEGLAIDNSLNAILPCDASGGATNGALDIGYSSTKFKDLYLSGGIYVGGTGSANYLDDYEEGIHQTTATPGTSGTITLISTNDDISYVKIGNSVHIVGCIVVQSGSAAVGSYIEFSLPFQITDLAGSSGRFGNAATYLDSSASTFSLLPMQALEGVSLVRVYIDASTVAVNDQFYFSFLYRGA